MALRFPWHKAPHLLSDIHLFTFLRKLASARHYAGHWGAMMNEAQCLAPRSSLLCDREILRCSPHQLTETQQERCWDKGWERACLLQFYILACPQVVGPLPDHSMLALRSVPFSFFSLLSGMSSFLLKNSCRQTLPPPGSLCEPPPACVPLIVFII